LPDQFDRFGSVGCLSEHFEVCLRFQKAPQAIAENGMVVSDYQTNLVTFSKVHAVLPRS
jgi:hypothetical protein